MTRSIYFIGTTLTAIALAFGEHGELGDELRPFGPLSLGVGGEHIVPLPPASRRSGSHLPHPSYLNTTAQLSQQRRLAYEGHHETKGIFQNLVLLLRFADHTSRSLPSRSDINKLYNSNEPVSLTSDDDIIPTGSIRQFYMVNSFNRFKIDTTVVPWITLSKNEAYYANGNHGFTKLKEAIIEALTVLDNHEPNNPKLSQFMENFSFGDFDHDENGALDGLGIIHSGFGAEFSGTDCYGTSNENRIWSHKGGLDWVSTHEPVKTNRYYVSSALRGTCDNNIVRVGLICHELGHAMGLPDLYDGTFEGVGLGSFDFMSQSWGFDGSGTYPPLGTAWTKMQAGWVDVLTITASGEYELEASSESNVVFKITHGFPDGEYLLLENRQPMSYDSRLPQGGIAIFHVDESSKNQKARGFPGQVGWPGNGKHYKVALLAADGKYDLEQGLNQGDAYDLWHANSLYNELRPGSAGVHPNTDSYQNGNVEQTGLRIHGFSSSGRRMTFRVEGIPSPPSRSPTEQPTREPSKHPTQLPSKPQTALPSQKPTSQPSEPPISPMPTSSSCEDRCLTPITSNNCPPNSPRIPSCLVVDVGELCDADGECDTNQFLNNCFGYDVYRRDHCPQQDSLGQNDLTWSLGANERVKNVTPDHPLESTESPVPPILQQLTSNLPENVQLRDPPVLHQSATNLPMSQPTHPPATSKPTHKLTILASTGSKTDEAAASSSADVTSITSTEDGCPHYYPRWNIGLNYCLKDCESPIYMRGNPIFEFDSLKACCSLHYQGKKSCMVQSFEAIQERISASQGLPSIHGRAWKDLNANDWQDQSERLFNSGMHGIMFELYECHSNTWVTMTRTSADGSYMLSAVEPGTYYVRTSIPVGFHLSARQAGSNAVYDSDFDEITGMSKCMTLQEGSGDVVLDAGLVEEDELVVEEEDEAVGLIPKEEENEVVFGPEPVKPKSVLAPASQASLNTSPDNSLTRAHNKSWTRQSSPDPASAQHQHSKSFLRGSVSSDAVVAVTHPTDATTIRSTERNSFAGGEELRVGPQSPTRHDDVLVKFVITPAFLGEKDYRTAKSASLRLYSLSSSPTGGLVHNTDDKSWRESTVTWTSAPKAEDVLSAIGETRPNQWVVVDVTGALLTESGVVSLRIAAEESNHSWAAKYSRRGHAPELRISF